jgi:hypothetical protein
MGLGSRSTTEALADSMLTLLFALTASAAPTTYTVESCSYDPEIGASSDWRTTDLQCWTARLSCAASDAKGWQRCEFPEQAVMWSYRFQGEQALHTKTVRVDADLAFRRNAVGRVTATDWDGDMRPFHQDAAQRLVALSKHRSDGYFKPDATRRIGEDAANDLARVLSGSLELERSRDESATTWNSNKTPQSARRLSNSVSSSSLRYQTNDTSHPRVGSITYTGHSTESLATLSGSTMDYTLRSDIQGKATWDHANGRLLDQHVHVRSEGAYGMFGFRQHETTVQYIPE